MTGGKPLLNAVLELCKEVSGMDLFQLNWSKGGLLNDACFILASEDLDSSGVNDHNDVSAVFGRN